MNDSEAPDSVPDEDDEAERVRDRLCGDDSQSAPLSEDALVDGDTIGTALREEANRNPPQAADGAFPSENCLG